MPAALLIVLSGCSGDSAQDRQTASTPTGGTPATTSSAPASEQGGLTLASGVSVNYRCVGNGAPAILLEAGTVSGGTDSFPPGFIDPLAKATRCAPTTGSARA
jgi:hypothetical protein